jgi:hypothetical protein
VQCPKSANCPVNDKDGYKAVRSFFLCVVWVLRRGSARNKRPADDVNSASAHAARTQLNNPHTHSPHNTNHHHPSKICEPFVSSCLSTSNKCLGKVVCQGVACPPGVAGTMCFTLGNSDKNFKV